LFWKQDGLRRRSPADGIAQRNGFVSGGAIGVRPAGTREALPGANRRSATFSGGAQDNFSSRELRFAKRVAPQKSSE